MVDATSGQQIRHAERARLGMISRARAMAEIGEIDFRVALAREIDQPWHKHRLDTVLLCPMEQVQAWAREGREYLDALAPGALGVTAFEVAQRYAIGQIDRDTMIEALATWPYDPPFEPVNVLDDLPSSGPGTFDKTVVRAFRIGLLTAEEYDGVIARSEELAGGAGPSGSA